MKAKSDYILFLENDFKMDVSLSRETIQRELIAGIAMLDSGAQVVRLQSRKYKGCGTHKDCDHSGIHLQSSHPGDRLRNWFAFYCKGRPGSEPFVDDCLDSPEYRCFTSWDSNWTLNAVLVKKSSIINKLYKTSQGMKSIATIAKESSDKQDAFETAMINLNWMSWRVPICLSYNGIFIHEEIETAS